MTPLYKKLGIKSDQSILVINYADDYLQLFESFPENITILKNRPPEKLAFAHLFINSKDELSKFYYDAKECLKKDGMLWISWPKGGKSKDINRDIIRVYGLANGLVDVKVASVNAYWSALKFVYRLTDR